MSKFKRILPVFLAIITIAAIVSSALILTFAQSNIESDEPIEVLAYDPDNPHSANSISTGDSYGIRMGYGAPFDAVSLSIPTYLTADSSVRVSLYTLHDVEEETTTEEITTEEMTAEETVDETTTDEMTSEEMTSEEMTVEETTDGETISEEAASAEATTEETTAESSSATDILSEEATSNAETEAYPSDESENDENDKNDENDEGGCFAGFSEQIIFFTAALSLTVFITQKKKRLL